MLDTLRSYGLRRSDLAWRVNLASGACSLVGQGTLAILGEGTLFGQMLP